MFLIMILFIDKVLNKVNLISLIKMNDMCVKILIYGFSQIIEISDYVLNYFIALIKYDIVEWQWSMNVLQS